MNIKEILESKPHNQHYLNRYIKFIEFCKVKNIEYEGYTETHHICPKAPDLFPEYSDIKLHKWNSVKLTARQHILSHIILWKTFGGSQAMAIDCMLDNFTSSKNSYSLTERVVPLSISIRYLAKAREAASKERAKYVMGKSTYLDSTGEKYFIETDSHLIDELKLTHIKLGSKHTEDSKQKMSDTKYSNKTVKLYFLDSSVWIGLFSDEFEQYIAQGWKTYKNSDDYEYTRNLGNAKMAVFWTGRNRYATPDGIYFGSYLKGDPIIEKYDLILYRTEKQIAQNLARTDLATAARLGTNFYTNGIDEIFANEPPDATWSLGRKPRSEEWEVKRKAAAAKKFKGSTTYTNGLVNMPIQDGDHIPDGFYPGMKKRPNTTYSYTNKDKSVLIQFTGEHEVPVDMIRIKGIESIDSLKRKLNI